MTTIAGIQIPDSALATLALTAHAADAVLKVAATAVPHAEILNHITAPNPPAQSSFTPSPTKLFCRQMLPSGLG